LRFVNAPANRSLLSTKPSCHNRAHSGAFLLLLGLRQRPHLADNQSSESRKNMQCFYFAKTRNMVALWASHYAGNTEADEAFYDAIRLFYPVPAILYDKGFPHLTSDEESEERARATEPRYDSL